MNLVTPCRSKLDSSGGHGAATATRGLFRCVKESRSTTYAGVGEHEVDALRAFVVACQLCGNATDLLKPGESKEGGGPAVGLCAHDI